MKVFIYKEKPLKHFVFRRELWKTNNRKLVAFGLHVPYTDFEFIF